MIIRLKNQERLLDLTINYHNIFQSWHWLFHDDNFLESDYMKNLMGWLFMAYHKDVSPAVRPSIKQNIFKPFHECHIDSCLAVVVTEYPTTSHKSSGIGVGNYLGVPPYAMTDEIELFRKALENDLYNGHMNPSFDYTLEEASQNGVLFLNMALTCTEDDNKAHVKYWDKFISHFIEKFQDATAEKAFLFIGDACKYADLVDTRYHEVITEENSIDEAIKNKTYWNTNAFSELNAVLTQQNSEFYRNPII